MTTLREHIEFYGNSGLLMQLRRSEPKDYDDFVGALLIDIDKILGSLEGMAKDLMSAGEDFINRMIVKDLNIVGYNASHDNDENGHVDIHVRPSNNAYSWLGEAKLDKGPAYLMAGLNQLATRYARGTPGHNRGGLLIYVQKDRCSERFATWKEHLTQEGPAHFEDLEMEDCSQRPGLAFISSFVLKRMGNQVSKYAVRHVAASFYRTASDDSD